MCIVLINYPDAWVFFMDWDINIILAQNIRVFSWDNQCPSHFGKGGKLGQMQLC